MIRSLIFRSHFTCSKCPRLVSNRKQIVWGFGNDQAKIMLTGEAPGREEDISGFPFCNPNGAGRELDECLESIGLKRDDVFISNNCLCRPVDNSDPTKQEKENCRPILLEQLKIIRPKIIVGLGRHSSNTLLSLSFGGNQKEFSLSFLRSMNPQDLYIHQIKLNFKFISSYHPASWLYPAKTGENRKDEAFKDWALIKTLI